MRIVAGIFVFSCILSLVRSQSEDSGWWSTRITKIDAEERHRGGLASEDNRRQDGGRRGEEEAREAAPARDSRRRPTPFASVSPWNAETRFRGRFERRREKYRREKVSLEDFVVVDAPPEPSPILLPPFYSSSSSSSSSSSPAHRTDVFQENATTPGWNNESSPDGGKSGTTSTAALERIRIYEITTSNSTSNGAVESEASHANYHESSKSSAVDDGENHRRNRPAHSRDDRTKQKNGGLWEDGRDAKNGIRSFYIDEKRRTGRFNGVKGRNYLVETFRGNKRYRDEVLDEEAFTGKRTFSGSTRYESPRRVGELSDRSRFHDDTNTEVGSVPGVPGRDYPIHQEHTHHHLRNVIDRFPCPRAPKTHIYLPDRASRCQIFYVCYGSQTGVPMVCPNGTLFNEPLQVCDWWYNVSC